MRARAMSYGIRALFPEMLLGIYTDIDMADADDSDEYKVEMAEDGQIVVLENKEE